MSVNPQALAVQYRCCYEHPLEVALKDYEEGSLTIPEVVTILGGEVPGIRVYGTQGGGLAKRDGNDYIFVEVPDWGDFQVGDEVPREWDLQGPFLYRPGQNNDKLKRAD